MIPANVALLADIENFLSAHTMSASAFGTRVLSDPRFVFELRKGRSLRAATVLHVRGFMAACAPGESHPPSSAELPPRDRDRPPRGDRPSSREQSPLPIERDESDGMEEFNDRRGAMRRGSARLLAALRREHPEIAGVVPRGIAHRRLEHLANVMRDSPGDRRHGA